MRLYIVFGNFLLPGILASDCDYLWFYLKTLTGQMLCWSLYMTIHELQIKKYVGWLSKFLLFPWKQYESTVAFSLTRSYVGST